MASLVGPVIAAGPTAKVNHLVANIVMVDDSGQAVGRVVANFTEPSLSELVPGTVDVYWNWYDPDSQPPFPFMDLQWPPVRESHAQLLASWFKTETDTGDTVGGADGFLCDYTAPWNSGCRPFWVQFRVTPVGERSVSWGVALDVTGNPNDNVVEFRFGAGAFALTFAGDTGS